MVDFGSEFHFGWLKRVVDRKEQLQSKFSTLVWAVGLNEITDSITTDSITFTKSSVKSNVLIKFAFKTNKILCNVKNLAICLPDLNLNITDCFSLQAGMRTDIIRLLVLDIPTHDF